MYGVMSLMTDGDKHYIKERFSVNVTQPCKCEKCGWEGTNGDLNATFWINAVDLHCPNGHFIGQTWAQPGKYICYF